MPGEISRTCANFEGCVPAVRLFAVTVRSVKAHRGRKGRAAMTDVSVEEPNLSLQPSIVSDPEEPHKGELLEQFYLTLSVMFMGAPRVERSVVHERIERLFASEHSWRNAYEIEQLLCFVLADQQIAGELDRRLAEAKALKLQYLDVICREPEAGKTVDKRLVLHRLLNDLQWFYAKRVQYRSASKRLMLRVSLLFIVALVTLFLVLFIQFLAHRSMASGGKPEVAAANATQAPEKPGGDK